MPANRVNTGALHPCPGCGRRTRADLFNAFVRPMEPAVVGEQVQAQGQAECFYHPGKKAVTPCAACGRLLCALCEVKLDGRSLCMGCLQAGKTKGRIERLQNSRLLYDRLALNLAFLPLFFFFITIVTAPAAIYVVLRYWKAPNSILPRSRFRFVLALILALAQVVGWGIFLVRMLQ